MSDKHHAVAKVHIYGDTLMHRLCPILRTQLWIEIDHQVTVKKGTLKKLHQTLSKIYKRKPKSDNTAVVMIGTYDIMKYNLQKSTKKYVKDMKRRVNMLVNLLRKTHKHLILLTPIPILKMQDLQYHWRVLRKYNKYLKRFSRDDSTTVFDTVPLFMRSKKPPKCKSDLYEKTSCLGCPKGEIDVLWNENGIRKILPAIIQKGNGNHFSTYNLFKSAICIGSRNIYT